jgi:transketolase
MSSQASDAATWHLHTLLDQAPGFGALSDTLSELVADGYPVVAGTADLKYSNGLVSFQRRHPERFVQFGISEQNMVSAAAGMAASGLRPYVATFASFLALLCCEQIRTDIAYTGLPVRLIGHHAGITLGFYGTSHHATEDLAIMRSIAGLDVVAPADATQLSQALRAYAEIDGPAYIRIGRGREPDVYSAGEPAAFKRGQAIRHGEAGVDLTIIATGSMLHPTLAAAGELRDEGISVGVFDMHTIKPLDREAVLAATASAAVMTVEEHSVLGGLGGAVAELMAEAGTATRLYRHGMQDTFSLIGPPTHLYAHYGLDAAGIAERARRALGSSAGASERS